MFKFTKVLAIGLVSVAAISCGKKEETQGVITSDSQRPTDVVITEVMKGNYIDTYVLPGVAEAWDTVAIPSETMGRVVAVYVVEGQSVKAGQPLLSVNTDTLKANVSSAKVQLEARKNDLNRTENLYKENAVAQKTYDDAKDAYSLAKVAYDVAVIELNKSTIKSPTDGIVDDIVPEVGEYIQPSMQVATVVQMDKLKIYIDVPEQDVKYMTVGQDVEVYLASAGEAENSIVGKINYVSVISNPTTLTFSARIDIAGDQGIMPGQIVRAKIVKQKFDNAIALEMYNIIDKDGQKVVYLVENFRSKEVPVTLGAMFDDMVVITGGLSEGDQLVTTGQQFLRNDIPIRVVE